MIITLMSIYTIGDFTGIEIAYRYFRKTILRKLAGFLV